MMPAGRCFAILIVLALSGPPLAAQLVDDGNAILFTGKTNLTGNLVVGTNAGNTSLTLFSVPFVVDAIVTNLNGIIGLNATSTTNEVILENAGAIWANLGNLYVGSGGSGNRLVVNNGGQVFSSLGYVGFSGTASNNTATVVGTNSLWRNSQLTIGQGGSGNVLRVANGGAVQMSRELTLGYFGSSNVLHIANGGYVENDSGQLALNGSRGNVAIVADSGSMWTNAGGLYLGGNSSVGGGVGHFNQLWVTNGGALEVGRVLSVGDNGNSNRLWITDGGTARSGPASIGRSATTVGNTAVVAGPGSRWLVGSGGVDVGRDSAFNLLVVSNGAKLVTYGGSVGGGGALDARTNIAIVTGPGSACTNTSLLTVGGAGSFNQLILSNGAVLWQTAPGGHLRLGMWSSGSNNAVAIHGENSLFSNRGFGARTEVGWFGSANLLSIRGGAAAETDHGSIGVNTGSRSNLVVLADPGSRWAVATNLHVGESGAFSQLIISNGGMSTVGALLVGSNPGSSNNAVTINSGSLVATNAEGLGTIDVRRGTLRLVSGLVIADQLWLTNGAQSRFNFEGGTLQTFISVVSNGAALLIGNGTSPATFELLAGGIHLFADGLRVASNALLGGVGILIGELTNEPGGIVSPGWPVGRLILSNSPALQGTLFMEISKSDMTRTNDHLQVAAPLIYSGTLIVSNVGPSALEAGDRFPLFSAPVYGGAFGTLSLPKPGPGLNWSNRLLLDGSIEIVPWGGPRISDVALAGTNLLIGVADGFPGGVWQLLTATNLSEPFSNWAPLATGAFDWLGNAVVTQALRRAEPRRFFAVRAP